MLYRKREDYSNSTKPPGYHPSDRVAPNKEKPSPKKEAVKGIRMQGQRVSWTCRTTMGGNFVETAMILETEH